MLGVAVVAQPCWPHGAGWTAGSSPM